MKQQLTVEQSTEQQPSECKHCNADGIHCDKHYEPAGENVWVYPCHLQEFPCSYYATSRKRRKTMKILDLVLKHKWYDMEESGEKPEEYRDLSDYWVKRFLRLDSGRKGALEYLSSLSTSQVWQEYTHVRFHRGYTSTTMLFKIKSMHIGFGNPSWGAPTDREVFIIKLGKKYEN